MGGRKLIVITDFFRRQISFDPKLLGHDIELRLLQETNEANLPDDIEKADALIVDKTPIGQSTISRLEKCRVIVRFGTGYDNVDLQAAGRKGIYVCNVPDFCTEEVADHAVGLLLCLSRSIVAYNNRLVESGVFGWGPLGVAETMRLRGKTIGIVGLGKIGKKVMQRCKALGLKVIFYDPYLKPSKTRKIRATRAKNLSEIASKCDFISFHIPLTKETAGMAGKSFFSSLRHGAALINTSRGGIVDTEEMYTALKSGRLSKAALDVLEKEPIDFSLPIFAEWLNDRRFRERLVITPHSAFYSPESTEEIKMKMIKNIKMVFSGRKPLNCVNMKYVKPDNESMHGKK